jgi:hypothetical protein
MHMFFLINLILIFYISYFLINIYPIYIILLLFIMLIVYYGIHQKDLNILLLSYKLISISKYRYSMLIVIAF